MKQYALIAEECIMPEEALMFPIVTNHSFNHVIESVQIVDASGQESTVLKNWITFRWVESDTNGFDQMQLDCIEQCRKHYNARHSTQIDFQIIGDAGFARGFTNYTAV